MMSDNISIMFFWRG